MPHEILPIFQEDFQFSHNINSFTTLAVTRKTKKNKFIYQLFHKTSDRNEAFFTVKTVSLFLESKREFKNGIMKNNEAQDATLETPSVFMLSAFRIAGILAEMLKIVTNEILGNVKYYKIRFARG